MRICDISLENRPRERFLKQGPEVLSDAELFAILLRTGTIHENVIDMSNRLLSEYSLDRLFDCSLKELQKIKGIGQIKAMQILAMSELGKRYKKSKNQTKKIACSEDVFNYFHEILKDKKQEYFYILMLNTLNHIIGEQLISKGGLDSSLAHPREIFKEAIKNSAAKIILIHNHPSGIVQPSKMDEHITDRFNESGKLLKIKVMDHVIIGKEEYYSFRENSKLI